MGWLKVNQVGLRESWGTLYMEYLGDTTGAKVGMAKGSWCVLHSCHLDGTAGVWVSMGEGAALQGHLELVWAF